MFFKKKKIIPKDHRTYKTPFLLGGVGVLMIFLMGIFAVQAANNLNFQVFDFAKPNLFLTGSINIFGNKGSQAPKIEKKKETKYILVTGKGGGNHDAPDLTDSLILVGLNSQEQTISMLSIPRDLYVEYPKTNETGKINEVYYRGLSRGKEQAMNELMGKITEITGKEIDSYINLNFQGFIEIVDALGGVEVTLEENLVDYNYPNGTRGYQTFILKKGTWNLDGDVALKYARSRYSTSDFDRSLRQQEIISGLKEKVSELGYFKDRKKIKELYDIINEYIETNLGITEIVELALELRSWEDSKTLSFNLNDSCSFEVSDCEVGGFLYTPLREYFDGKSVILPNKATYYELNTYGEIQDFAGLIFDAPKAYTKPKDIVIYNASGKGGQAKNYYDVLKPYGIVKEDFVELENLTEKKFENSILYYNALPDDSRLIGLLEKVLDIESEKIDGPAFSGTGTHIEIIIGDGIKREALPSSGSLRE